MPNVKRQGLMGLDQPFLNCMGLDQPFLNRKGLGHPVDLEEKLSSEEASSFKWHQGPLYRWIVRKPNVSLLVIPNGNHPTRIW